MSEIKTTKNYDQFKKMVGNRAIDEKFVRKMAANIKEYGLINPIVVNENMEVIDGQHRLEAAKLLGIPVKYIVNKETYSDVKMVQEINRFQHKWTQEDRVRSLATMGNGTCKWIMLMKKDHNWIKVSALLKMMSIKTNDLTEDLVLNLEERSKYERKLEYLDGFADMFASFSGRREPLISAFGFCYDHPDVDNDRLLKVTEAARYDWISCSSAAAAMRQIEALYNKGLKGRRLSLVIDYDNFLKERLTH